MLEGCRVVAGCAGAKGAGGRRPEPGGSFHHDLRAMSALYRYTGFSWCPPVIHVAKNPDYASISLFLLPEGNQLLVGFLLLGYINKVSNNQ